MTSKSSGTPAHRATSWSVWAATGMVETITSVSPAASSSGTSSTRGRRGCDAIRSAASVARSRSRTATRTDDAPSSTIASPVDAAVAPPPRMVADPIAPSYRSRTAATAPGRSVLSARSSPPSSRSVLAEPTRSTRPVTTSASLIASRLSGAVTDKPRQSSPRPATNPASSPAGTRVASYSQSRPTAA